jgi:hypothetical protein
MLAVPVVVTASAGPATAAVPDHWGFAYMNDATPVAGQVLDPTRAWGSWKALFPADPVRVWHNGSGRYLVRFPHIASRGVAHVTAVAGDARWCQLQAAVPSGADQDVHVQCYRHGGAPQPATFSVVYSSSSGAPVASGAYAYTYVDPAGNLVDSFNSTGAANAAVRGAVGRYRVTVPAPVSGYEGGIEVTAEHANSPRRCKVDAWRPVVGGHFVYVNCYDQASALADSWFHLTYQQKRSHFGALAPPDNLAYLWSPALGGPTDYNSQGGVNTITPSGVGQYLVVFPRIGVRETNVQATAYGPSPDYCNLQAPWGAVGDLVVRNVICFNAAGAQAPNRFFVAGSSRV